MMTKENDNVIIICGPVDRNATEGQKTKCAKCNDDIWMSNSSISSVKMHSESPPIILCIPCGMGKIKKEKNVEVMPISDEQWTEILTLSKL